MAQRCTLQTLVFQSHLLVEILEGVRVDFEDLSEILAAHTPTSSESVLLQGWKQVRWVFRESEVADLRRSIEAYKSSLLTLMFAKLSEVPDRQTAEDIAVEMATIRKELADVRALCDQLKNRNRFMSRLARSTSSLDQFQAKTSAASLAAATPTDTDQTTASAQIGYFTRNNRSDGSITSISSYWAASIIDLYCSELEDIAQSSVQTGLNSAAPDIRISSTGQNQTTQPSRASSRGEASPPTRLLIRPSSVTTTWLFPASQYYSMRAHRYKLRAGAYANRRRHRQHFLF